MNTIKKSYSLLFYILILIFIGILFYSFFIKDIVEGFSLDTSSVSSTTSSVSSTSAVGYYDNLSRLPADNSWTPSTKKQVLDYLNTDLISKEPNATPMTEESTDYLNFIQRYQPFATDSEVAYYIKNGEWQWDGYVNDYIQKTIKPLEMQKGGMTQEQIDEEFKKAPKILTNRMIYTNSIMQLSVPQLAIIKKLNTSGLEPQIGTKLQCVFLKEGEQNQPDGKTTIKIEKDGKYLQVNNMYTLDNNAWTANIPGFAFKSDPCNVCQIENYTDTKNTCLFTINTPEAFEKFMGDNSLTSSTSSSFGSLGSSDKDKKDDKSKKDN